METGHPVEASYGSEFPAICNHCGIMAAGTPKRRKLNLIFGISLSSSRVISLSIKGSDLRRDRSGCITSK